MPVLRAAERRRLRQIYGFRCGYCGVTETDVGAELTEDHFQPLAHGGDNAFANIVYACHACNEFKGNWWNPQGDDRIIHPLQEDQTLHLTENLDGILTAVTPTGDFHLRLLRLNRPALVAYRRERAMIVAGQRRIAIIEREVAAIREAVEEIVRRVLPEDTP